MTYYCDLCDAILPTGYVPEVDGRGRPVLAICKACAAIQRREREQRLGLTAEPGDLTDRFERVLTRIFPPERIH